MKKGRDEGWYRLMQGTVNSHVGRRRTAGSSATVKTDAGQLRRGRRLRHRLHRPRGRHRRAPRAQGPARPQRRRAQPEGPPGRRAHASNCAAPRARRGRCTRPGRPTLGGYFPGVDTFLGLQVAAQEIADDLARRGFCQRIGPRARSASGSNGPRTSRSEVTMLPTLADGSSRALSRRRADQDGHDAAHSERTDPVADLLPRDDRRLLDLHHGLAAARDASTAPTSRGSTAPGRLRRAAVDRPSSASSGSASTTSSCSGAGRRTGRRSSGSSRSSTRASWSYFLGDNGVLPWVRGPRAALRRRTIGVIPFWFFWPLFIVVWLAVWIWVNGPMRVFNIHWRFFGGRLV